LAFEQFGCTADAANNISASPDDNHGQETRLQPQCQPRRRKRDAPLQARHGKERTRRPRRPVKSRKQAIAIGLSKAQKKGKKVPRKKR
jgi:Family of unknown function (DUF6496)